MQASVTTEHDQLLTEAEAARLRRQSIRTLQAERLRGDGCPHVKLGRSVRYRRSDVLKFIEANVRTSIVSPFDADLVHDHIKVFVSTVAQRRGLARATVLDLVDRAVERLEENDQNQVEGGG
jgi:hypothetical protein